MRRSFSSPPSASYTVTVCSAAAVSACVLSFIACLLPRKNLEPPRHKDTKKFWLTIRICSWLLALGSPLSALSRFYHASRSATIGGCDNAARVPAQGLKPTHNKPSAG